MLGEREGGGGTVVVYVGGRKAVLDGVVLEAVNDQDSIFVKKLIELDPYQGPRCDHWWQKKMACWTRYLSLLEQQSLSVFFVLWPLLSEYKMNVMSQWGAAGLGRVDE